MRIALSLALGALALAACSRQEPAPAAVWRDRSAPISSAAVFDLDRAGGTWAVVAGYPDGTDCDGPGFEIGATHLSLICDGTVDATGDLTVVGPGRLMADLGPDQPRNLWVLWVDWDYRTLVLAAPDGAAAWVLNRGADIPSDRMAASREMLSFNGFDTAALVSYRD